MPFFVEAKTAHDYKRVHVSTRIAAQGTMTAAPKIARQLDEMTRRYNRDLVRDAALRALLGVVFSVLTFGFVYWFGWFLGFFIGRYLGLAAWQFGLLLTAVFLAAATWSAWRNVQPLAGLKPLSEREWMLILVGQAAGLHYFSPRHASAGAAVVLIGGPANVLHALGMWTHRIRRGGPLMEDAAQLLLACAERCTAKEIQRPDAALLLRRLGLIKVIGDSETTALTVTDNGFKVLSVAKGNPGKGPERARAKRK